MKKRTISAVIAAILLVNMTQPAQAIWGLNWLFGPTLKTLNKEKKAVDKKIGDLLVKITGISKKTENQNTYIDTEIFVLSKNSKKLLKCIRGDKKTLNKLTNALDKQTISFNKISINKEIKEIENNILKLEKSSKNKKDLKRSFDKSRNKLTEIKNKLTEIENANFEITNLEKKAEIKSAEVAKLEIEWKVKQIKNNLGKNNSQLKQLEEAETSFFSEFMIRKNPEVAPKFLTTSWSKQKEWRRQNAKKTAFLYSVFTGAGAWASIKYLRKPLETVLKKKNLGWLSYSVYALPVISAYLFTRIFKWQTPSIENGQVTEKMIKKNFEQSELKKIIKNIEKNPSESEQESICNYNNTFSYGSTNNENYNFKEYQKIT